MSDNNSPISLNKFRSLKRKHIVIGVEENKKESPDETNKEASTSESKAQFSKVKISKQSQSKKTSKSKINDISNEKPEESSNIPEVTVDEPKVKTSKKSQSKENSKSKIQDVLNEKPEESSEISEGTVEVKVKTSKKSQAKKNSESKVKDVSNEESSKIPEVTINEPENWRTVLDNLREMRKARDAPVDSMGCDECADKGVSPIVQRYQSLIALMLSSQTKDPIVHATMLKLRTHGLTIENILATDDETLGELIYPVSFWKTKVKNIKLTTEILKEKFNNDIPSNIEGLVSLPGVGPKMAHLCMKTAWNEITGIGVDTHVHRIANRLGWVKPEAKTPENTRKRLEKWLPRELWKEVNHLMVGFGQQICSAKNPNCDSCLNNTLCPFGIKTLKGLNTGLKKVRRLRK